MQETQETWVLSQGQEDSLEEDMATHSSILAPNWEHTHINFGNSRFEEAPDGFSISPQAASCLQRKWQLSRLLSSFVGVLYSGPILWSDTLVLYSGPITSWEIDGETVETVSDFIFLGSKITADGDCSHEIKRRLLLRRKVMTNLDSIFKSRDIILPTKVRLVKAMVFPVVVYGRESWTMKKAEHRRIDTFELWCWRRLLRVPWTTRRSNQSKLKDISPGCSLEGMMLKLKVQYFDHLMRRVDSLEKTDAGRDWGQEEKGTT